MPLAAGWHPDVDCRAIEKLNATHQEISVTVEDIDHHSMLTQATTITSLQTGGFASTACVCVFVNIVGKAR